MVTFTLDLLTQTLINGTLLGGIYAILAIGLSFVFGTMRVTNAAHMVLAILGAYVSYWSYTLLGIDPWLTIPISFALLFLLAIPIERYLIKPVREFGMTNFLLTFAIGTFIENLMIVFWRNDFKSIISQYTAQSIVVGQFRFPLVRTVVFFLSFTTIALMIAFLYYTKLGKAVRATSQRRDISPLMGINVDRIYSLSFALGIGMAAVGGALMAQIFTFYPSMHVVWVGKLMAIVIFGGIGTIYGTLAAAFIMAYAEVFIGTIFTVIHGALIGFIVMLVIMFIRPEGILGGWK